MSIIDQTNPHSVIGEPLTHERMATELVATETLTPDSDTAESSIAARPRGRLALFVTSGAGSLGLLIGGIYALVGSRPLYDNSFLTHLATGRVILDRGLPEVNPFLYSSSSFPVPSYWWSIIVAAVEKVGSGVGLRLMTALLSGLLGLLIVRLGSFTAQHQPAPGQILDGARQPDRGTKTVLAVLVPTLLTTVCVLPFLNSRPQLPGFILLALAVLIWNERRSPWWLVPIFVAWVNIHGTWLYGIAVLGLFMVAEVIESRRIERTRVASVLAAIGGIVLGGALYPKPFEIMLLPTRQFGNEIEREALRMYIEWRPVATSDPMFWLLIGLGLVAIYGNVAGSSGVSGRRWASAISAVGLVLMGLSGYRLVPVAAIALVPLVSSSLSNLGSIPMFKGRVAVAVSILGALLFGASMINALVGPSYDLEMYPVKLVDRMVAADVIGGDIRSLTHDYAGNYLEWRLGERSNTFVDDRPGAETFLAYGAMLKLKSGWQDVLAEANPDVILWKHKEEFAGELRGSKDWFYAGKVDGWDLFCAKDLAASCARI